MKGKATITLADAATGRIIRQTEEHNMVTNALRSIFQPPKLSSFGGLNFSKTLNSFLPMSNTLLGGLVLLGENVDEDADDFMLKPRHRLIGHAGDPYSGTNIMRGTLNQNETYATENGYHFTWDFATDKANGIIRCVSLTNRLFGNTGVSPELNDGTVMVDMNEAKSPTYAPTVSLTAQLGQLAGMFESNILTYLGVANGEFYKKRVRLIDPLGIKINDVPGGEVISTETIEVPFIPDETKMFMDSINRRAYYFRLTSRTQEETVIELFWVDPVTKEVSESSTITLNGSYNLGVSAFFRDRLYTTDFTTVNVFSVSGGAGTHVGSWSYLGIRFFTQYNTLFLYGQCTTGMAICAAEDDGHSIMRMPGYCPVVTEQIRLPYTLMSVVSTGTDQAQLMMYTNYLATINNLSEPIEKTAEQTLKITYDIIN